MQLRGIIIAVILMLSALSGYIGTQSKGVLPNMNAFQGERAGDAPQTKRAASADVRFKTPIIEKWETYCDASQNISFRHPQDWRVIRGVDDSLMVASRTADSRHELYPGDNPESRFGISVAPLGYYSSPMRSVTANDVKTETVQTRIPHTSVATTTVSGYEAIIAYDVWNREDDAVAFVNNGRRYYQIWFGRFFDGHNTEEDWAVFSGVVMTLRFDAQCSTPQGAKGVDL